MKFSSLLCEFKEEKNADGELIVEKYVSLGRFSFWILIIIMCRFWFKEVEVPSSLYDVFFIILLYNFFKKPLSMLEGADLKAMFGKK